MPRFIRITENTLCWSYEPVDSIISEMRRNYTDIDTCVAMLKNPEAFNPSGSKGFLPFPMMSQMGTITIHVEGWNDYPHNPQDPPQQRETGHRCTPKCLEDRAQRRLKAMGLESPRIQV